VGFSTRDRNRVAPAAAHRPLVYWLEFWHTKTDLRPFELVEVLQRALARAPATAALGELAIIDADISTVDASGRAFVPFVDARQYFHFMENGVGVEASHIATVCPAESRQYEDMHEIPGRIYKASFTLLAANAADRSWTRPDPAMLSSAIAEACKPAVAGGKSLRNDVIVSISGSQKIEQTGQFAVYVRTLEELKLIAERCPTLVVGSARCVPNRFGFHTNHPSAHLHDLQLPPGITTTVLDDAFRLDPVVGPVYLTSGVQFSQIEGRRRTTGRLITTGELPSQHMVKAPLVGGWIRITPRADDPERILLLPTAQPFTPTPPPIPGKRARYYN